MRVPALLRFAIVGPAIAAVACGTDALELPSATVEAAVDDPVAADGPPRSNIHRADYVGPQACAECHTEQYAQWREHPHRRMNADATDDAVVGDFSGIDAEYGGATTVFERVGGAYVMSYYRDGILLRRDEVTRTIGSRFQQAYVGVQREGPEPPEHPIYATERALPWVYWFSRQRWYPEHFVEEYPEPEYDDDGELRYPIDDPYSRGTRPWSEGCMLCHNTYPWELRFNAEMPGRGFADASLHAAARAALDEGPRPDDLVTLGISCEACHLGGRDHVELERDPDAVPTSPRLAAWTPPGLEGARALDEPAVVMSICAQCHVAGTLPHPNAASSLNSSEALDMQSGACASAISCTDCHDPHTAGPPGGGPDAPAHVAACTGCHERLAAEPQRAAHARHDASIASCLDCHMPRITQGVDTVVRSHRIDSPTNAAMLAAGSPNACNLCHLDRSLAWTLAELERGWNVVIEPDGADRPWSEIYGPDRSTPLGEAWFRHPTPIVRLVATDAFARHPPRGDHVAAALRLVPGLLDEYPHNRMFALFAIERLLGRRIENDEYTPTAATSVRLRQVERLKRSMRSTRSR